MGTRTRYSPGTCSWVELSATDARAAESFYAALFGWEVDGSDLRDEPGYAIFKLGGDAVAGVVELPHAPTPGTASWIGYVTVEDADLAVTRATTLGGRAIDSAFDRADVARVAVLEDPQGAVFGVWQPGTRIGAERVNDVGCLVMNELATTDLQAARAYYEQLFGWDAESVETGPGGPPMLFVHNRGRMNASFVVVEPGEAAEWRPCFTVGSTADAVRRLLELGGRQLGEAVEIDGGQVAVVADPQGAVFSFFDGPIEP